MNTHDFTFAGAALRALPSGALWWPEAGLLVVSDLHLGKSERVARRTGQMLPPYEARETLSRLASDIARTDPAEVICRMINFRKQITSFSAQWKWAK